MLARAFGKFGAQMLKIRMRSRLVQAFAHVMDVLLSTLQEEGNHFLGGLRHHDTASRWTRAGRDWRTALSEIHENCLPKRARYSSPILPHTPFRRGASPRLLGATLCGKHGIIERSRAVGHETEVRIPIKKAP